MNATEFGGALSGSVNQPDTTSAPPENDPSSAQVQPLQNPVAQLLGQRKKKGFGPSVKNPGALAGAISRAKRARQGGQKYGN